MSWTNAEQNKYTIRDTKFNRSIIVDKDDFSNEVDVFKTVFGGIVDYSQEISSLMLYPLYKTLIEIPHDNTLGPIQVLKTSHGTTNVKAWEIKWNKNMFTLGQYYVKPKYNNFIDYKGYTTIKAFLPFLGYVDIDVNECMGKWLQFVLYVDFYTGKAMYLIGASERQIDYGLYPIFDIDYNIRFFATYELNLGIEIPLGSSNISDIKRNMLLGTIKTAASVGAAVYTGSLPPPVQTSTSTTTYGKMARGNYKGARMRQVTGGQDTTETVTTSQKAIDKSKPISEAIDGSIDTLSASYPSSHSDRVNDGGLLSSMSTNIHIVIYRPKILPVYSGYKHIFGQPLGVVRKIGMLSGYTVIASAHLEGDGFKTATRKELDMIENMLYNGVLLDDEDTPPITEKIQFTITTDDEVTVTAYAESGMSWYDWVDSAYNTVGAYVLGDDTRVYLPQIVSGDLPYITYNSTAINYDETIISGATYGLSADIPMSV